MRNIVLVVTMLLFGCGLDSLRPTNKLRQLVQDMNDAARWGRIDLAVQYVVPAYRQRFLANHSTWGRKIQVADLELVRIDMAPNKEIAVVLVAVSWYQLEYMTLHQSVVRQIWRQLDGQYLLGEEQVSEGEPSLMGALPRLSQRNSS